MFTVGCCPTLIRSRIMLGYKNFLVLLATMSFCAWLLCSSPMREGTGAPQTKTGGLIKLAFGKNLYSTHEIKLRSNSNLDVELENKVAKRPRWWDMQSGGSVKKQVAVRKLLQESSECISPGRCSKGAVLSLGTVDQSKKPAAFDAPTTIDSERLVPGGPDPLPLYRTRMPKSKEFQPALANTTLDSARLVPSGPDPLPFATHDDTPEARRAYPPPPASKTAERRPVPTVPPSNSSETSPGDLEPGTTLVTERLVPTGPDPLHHSTTPQRKIPPKLRPAECSSC